MTLFICLKLSFLKRNIFASLRLDENTELLYLPNSQRLIDSFAHNRSISNIFILFKLKWRHIFADRLRYNSKVIASFFSIVQLWFINDKTMHFEANSFPLGNINTFLFIIWSEFSPWRVTYMDVWFFLQVL